MESAYQAAYDLLDPSLQKALAEDGIRSDPTSANQFRIFWEQSKSVSPNCPVNSASFDQIADWLGIARIFPEYWKESLVRAGKIGKMLLSDLS